MRYLAGRASTASTTPPGSGSSGAGEAVLQRPLPPPPGRAEPVVGAVGRHPQQPGAGVLRLGKVRPCPQQADEGLLHHVLRVGPAARAGVGQAEHVPRRTAGPALPDCPRSAPCASLLSALNTVLRGSLVQKRGEIFARCKNSSLKARRGLPYQAPPLAGELPAQPAEGGRPNLRRRCAKGEVKAAGLLPGGPAFLSYFSRDWRRTFTRPPHTMPSSAAAWDRSYSFTASLPPRAHRGQGVQLHLVLHRAAPPRCPRRSRRAAPASMRPRPGGRSRASPRWCTAPPAPAGAAPGRGPGRPGPAPAGRRWTRQSPPGLPPDGQADGGVHPRPRIPREKPASSRACRTAATLVRLPIMPT